MVQQNQKNQKKSSSQSKSKSSNKKGGAVDLAVPFVPLALLTALKAMRDSKKGGSKKLKGGFVDAPQAPSTTGKSAVVPGAPPAPPAPPVMTQAPPSVTLSTPQSGGKKAKRGGSADAAMGALHALGLQGGKSKSKAKKGGSYEESLNEMANQNNNLLRGGRKYKGGFFFESDPSNPFATPGTNSSEPNLASPSVTLEPLDPTANPIPPMAPATTGKNAPQPDKYDLPAQSGGKKSKKSSSSSKQKQQKKQRGGELQQYANQLNDIMSKMNGLMGK